MTRDTASVEATLKFVLAENDKPVLYASKGGGDTTAHSALYEDKEVAVINGRLAATPADLEQEGFALRPHETQVQDFYDAGEVERVYDREVEDLVKAATGARKVVVFDHTLRADTQDKQAERGIREPAWFVHNDYTKDSAPKRVRDLLPAEEAEALLEGRFAIINVWRPIAKPVESSPLALCDARSVAPDDLVLSERRSPDGRVGEILLARFNPAHRWVYFPEMTRDETLLIKTYDSAQVASGRSTIHAAFEDPTTPADAPPRESIETRTFAFF